MATAEVALIKLADYIAQLETVLSSVDLNTRHYIDDYDYDGLPESHEEMMNWMDENRSMVYDCLQTIQEFIDGDFDDDYHLDDDDEV